MCQLKANKVENNQLFQKYISHNVLTYRFTLLKPLPKSQFQKVHSSQPLKNHLNPQFALFPPINPKPNHQAMPQHALQRRAAQDIHLSRCHSNDEDRD